jgi:hypothetical protein
MIPITTEVLFSLYGSHNQATWPAPLVGYVLCVAALLMAYRPFLGSSRMIAAILAAFWLWNGAVFHIGFFAPLNWGALIFGVFFILEGLLLLWMGLLRNRLDFRLTGAWRDPGHLALLAVAFAYPNLDMLAGHIWPQMQLPGTLPAPTVLATMAFLLMARDRGARVLSVIPVLWALIGGAAALSLGIWQDVVTAFLALAGAVLLFTSRGRSGEPSVNA